MSRILDAIRSGWNSSNSSSFSPVEANITGLPVTPTTDRAAPPRASPSSLDSTTPVKPTPSLNAVAVATASWPIIASRTNRISSGWTASRMSAACLISSASTPSRPAVSTITTSCCFSRANAIPRRATSTGSPGPACGSASAAAADAPGCGANTGTPARSPTTVSWSTAFGRCRSQATSSGVCPCWCSQRPSLPARVVLPAPCRPASRITVGGFFASCSRRVWPPSTSTNWSCTICTTCWAGFSACDTSIPRARSRTAAVKSRTTGRATSASSRARRISRTVASMSASDSRPLPRSDLKVAASRSESEANTGSGYPAQAGGSAPASSRAATTCATRGGESAPPPGSARYSTSTA